MKNNDAPKMPALDKMPDAYWNALFQFTSPKLSVRNYNFSSIHHAMLFYPRFFGVSKIYEYLNAKKEGFTTVTLENYEYAIPFILCLKEQAHIALNAKILDVGAFIGLGVSFLAELGFDQAYGIEPNITHLKLAKRLKVHNIFEGSIDNMHQVFENFKFDIIICTEVIHEQYFQPPDQNAKSLELHKKLIENSSKILNKNGIIMLKSDPKDIISELEQFLTETGFNILFSSRTHPSLRKIEIFAQKKG